MESDRTTNRPSPTALTSKRRCCQERESLHPTLSGCLSVFSHCLRSNNAIHVDDATSFFKTEAYSKLYTNRRRATCFRKSYKSTSVNPRKFARTAPAAVVRPARSRCAASLNNRRKPPDLGNLRRSCLFRRASMPGAFHHAQKTGKFFFAKGQG